MTQRAPGHSTTRAESSCSKPAGPSGRRRSRRTLSSNRSLRLESLELSNLLAADFGDAPLPYPAALAENGTRHEAVGPTLGLVRSADADGVHSAITEGDAGDDGVDFDSLRAGGRLT